MCSNNINTIYYGIESSYRECPKDWKESSPVTFVDEEHYIGAHSLTAVRPTEGDLYTLEEGQGEGKRPISIIT